MRYKISLIIPCYNEAQNLPTLIARCQLAFEGKPVEVIFVNNGSTDNSQQLLETTLAGQQQLKVVQVSKNQGYGYGILQGLKAGIGEFLAWTHADMQTDPADLLEALRMINDADEPQHLFIKGQRYGRPLADRFFTFGMSIFESLLLRTTLYDINAQPTIFTKTFFDEWKNPPHDFSLDLYAYYQAKVMKKTIKRFKVKFGDRLHGTSHWNINWQAKVKFIKRTMSYSFKLYKEIRNDNY